MVKVGEYDLPSDLYYHKDHTWARVEKDGTVTVGMNDFYQKSAGETTYIDLPFEGDEVMQGETCGKIQSAKWVGKVVSPVSGKITNVNRALEDDCTLINKSPYKDGWIMKIKPSNLEEDLKNLITGDKIEPWLRKEIEEAKKKRQ